MSNLFRELRRREVFRTAGLYVGICWILIEGASILLPAFDAPEWIMRAIIIIAVVGLPVTLVLAWIYDISDSGITVQGDPTDTIVEPIGGRKMDFFVIGVLSVALIFSVYMNVTDKGGEPAQIDPISILIADFDNQTGDSLFDGTLEQALQIGIESAPFIAGYRRDSAMRIASGLQTSSNVLDEATARLVAVREGVKLVMAGAIEEHSGSYTLYVRAIDPKGGEVLASAKVDARDKLDVLAAVGTLSGDLREELGDENLDREQLQMSETFTAANLEAAQAYAKAQSLQYNGKYDEAMQFYQQALEHDPGFGRAYSGLALSANALGRTDEAADLWDRALATLDTMTERERLRTLGLYYSIVTRNYQKAIETYETLVEKYPADDTAHNGLAVQRFYLLDFAGAREAGSRLLDVYPTSVMGWSNYALYAMYSSDFEIAVTAADKTRELDENYFKGWLPAAIDALSKDDVETALAAYESMRPAGIRGQLTSDLGIADANIYAGELDAADTSLAAGVARAEEAGSQYYLATLRMMQAELAALRDEEADQIRSAILSALEAGGRLSREVPAALLYLQIGDVVAAQAIADALGDSLQTQSRAYADLINGLIALGDGEHVDAIDSMVTGIGRADLWLLRYYLGRAYLEAGFFAEALDEFTACNERRGEASSIFLDDLPTWRYMSELPYWQARAQMELGMSDAAATNLQAFIARRPSGDALADDARQRLP